MLIFTVDMNMTATGTNRTKGFSFIEVLMVVIVTGTLIAFAIPGLTTLLQSARSNGEPRDVDDVVALAKMRAAADFTRARVYCDLSSETFEVDCWTAGAWSAESGATSFERCHRLGLGRTSPLHLLARPLLRRRCVADSGNAQRWPTLHALSSIPAEFRRPLRCAHCHRCALRNRWQLRLRRVTVLATGLIRMWRTGLTAAHWAIR